jgi:ATP adenylyltransferase
MTNSSDFQVAIMTLILHQHDCPFCRPEKNRIRMESEFAIAILDGFAVTEGHTLVIPR